MQDHEIIAVVVERKWLSFLMFVTGIGMLALGIIFPDPPENMTVQVTLRAVVIIFAFIPIIFCPRYRISFRNNSVVIAYGYFFPIKVRLDRNKITCVGLREWNPMRHFGGSGIKGGYGEFAGYICFNIFSGTGIEIRTTEKNYVIEMNDIERRRVLALIGDYAQAEESSNTTCN